MLLLEAVELYGLGNWTKISEHVGRSMHDCKSHYMSVYVETDCFPLPKPSKDMENIDVKKLIEDRRRAGAERAALAKQASLRRSRSNAARSTRNDQPIKFDIDGFEAFDEDIAIDLEEEAGQKGEKGTTSKNMKAKKKSNHAAVETPSACQTTTTATPAAAIDNTPNAAASATGVTPSLVAKKNPHDLSAPVMLSEAQQTGYHIKRNEFELDYDPEAEEIVAELEFGEDEPEWVIAEKLRLIEIYNRRLDERHRRHEYVLSRGLVNVKRQQAFDRRRSATEKEYVGRLRVLARYLPQPQWDTLADGLAAEARLRARIGELQQYRAMGMRTFDQVEKYEAMDKKKKDPPPAAQVGKSRLQKIPVDETAMETELAELDQPLAVLSLHAQHSTVPEGRGADGLQGWRTRRGVLFDVAVLPDIEPLTQKERQLCANERYLPAQYLAVKAEVARMQKEKGGVTKHDVQNLPFLVDKDRSGRLHAFFLEQGWIMVPSGSLHGGGRK